MYLIRHTVAVTTIGDGTATAYSPPVNGKLIHVQYVKVDYPNGVDFTITSETTQQNIWVDTNVDASETVSPRVPTHDTAGAASLYAATGEPVEDYLHLANERIKVVIAAGGDTKTGTFHFTVGG